MAGIGRRYLGVNLRPLIAAVGALWILTVAAVVAASVAAKVASTNLESRDAQLPRDGLIIDLASTIGVTEAGDVYAVIDSSTSGAVEIDDIPFQAISRAHTILNLDVPRFDFAPYESGGPPNVSGEISISKALADATACEVGCSAEFEGEPVVVTGVFRTPSDSGAVEVHTVGRYRAGEPFRDGSALVYLDRAAAPMSVIESSSNLTRNRGESVNRSDELAGWIPSRALMIGLVILGAFASGATMTFVVWRSLLPNVDALRQLGLPGDRLLAESVRSAGFFAIGLGGIAYLAGLGLFSVSSGLIERSVRQQWASRTAPLGAGLLPVMIFIAVVVVSLVAGSALAWRLPRRRGDGLPAPSTLVDSKPVLAVACLAVAFIGFVVASNLDAVILLALFFASIALVGGALAAARHAAHRRSIWKISLSLPSIVWIVSIGTVALLLAPSVFVATGARAMILSSIRDQQYPAPLGAYIVQGPNADVAALSTRVKSLSEDGVRSLEFTIIGTDARPVRVMDRRTGQCARTRWIRDCMMMDPQSTRVYQVGLMSDEDLAHLRQAYGEEAAAGPVASTGLSDPSLIAFSRDYRTVLSAETLADDETTEIRGLGDVLPGILATPEDLVPLLGDDALPARERGLVILGVIGASHAQVRAAVASAGPSVSLHYQDEVYDTRLREVAEWSPWVGALTSGLFVVLIARVVEAQQIATLNVLHNVGFSRRRRARMVTGQASLAVIGGILATGVGAMFVFGFLSRQLSVVVDAGRPVLLQLVLGASLGALVAYALVASAPRRSLGTDTLS